MLKSCNDIILLVLSREWMGMGVAGIIIDRYCGSFPHSLRLAQVSHGGNENHQPEGLARSSRWRWYLDEQNMLWATHRSWYIRRPRPSPRQGRRLGPPQVWSLFLLACHYLAFRQLRQGTKGHSHSMSQPHCTLQTLQRSPGLKPLKCLKPSAAAWTRHSGHSPLLFRAFKPAVCQASNAQLGPGTQATALCC